MEHDGTYLVESRLVWKRGCPESPMVYYHMISSKFNLPFWGASGCFLFSDEPIWNHEPVAFVGQPLFMPPSWVVLVGHKALFGRLSGGKDAKTRVHKGIPRQRHATLSHHRGILNARIQVRTIMQLLRLVPHAARQWAAQNSKGQNRPFPERRHSSGIKSWNAIHQRTFRKAEYLGFADVAIKDQLHYMQNLIYIYIYISDDICSS